MPGPRTADGDHLSARQAVSALRLVGPRELARQSFARFRYGDGFSHSRALALQLCLALVPLVIALVGLSSALHTERAGRVLRETVLSLATGDDGDGPATGALRTTLERALAREQSEDAVTAVLVLGLATGLVALTTAMGQVERGANRIYGIARDRPTLHKYARAAVLTAAAGLPAVLGFLLVVAGPAAERAVAQVYGVDRTLLVVLRLPVSLLLSLSAITVLLRYAPRRQQPGWSWLSLGAATALLMWMLLSWLLGAYLERSGAFGAVYGPLTNVMALLLWAQLTSMAIFLAVAFTAQLEAARAGLREAALPDPDPPDAATTGALTAVLRPVRRLLHRLRRHDAPRGLSRRQRSLTAAPGERR